MTGHSVILDPSAQCSGTAQPVHKVLGGLEGRVVGFIDNSKPNFNHLVDDLAEVLVERYGVAAVVKHRKRAASIPAPAAVMADLKEKCDLVITGSGD
jgi:hypothetical protein